MRTIYLVSLAFLFVLFSCKSETKIKASKVKFGIHQVVKINEISHEVIDSLKSLGVQIESNSQKPVIGYISADDSLFCKYDIANENIKILKIIQITEEEQKYTALAAIKSNAVMDVSSIKKTKANGNNVEIHFSLDGAKQWADFTKQNVGNSIAFVIDDEIYSMPLINAEIKHGIAMIAGLKDEASSKYISESLNLSIDK